jgi:hypothetical protein
MKIETSDLPKILESQGLEKTKISAIVSAAETLAKKIREENKVDSDEPKKKNEFLVAMFKSDLVSETPLAYVLTQKEGEDAGLVLGRLSNAAREFNMTKRGKKRPILGLAECFSSLKRKFVKAEAGGINVKTKQAVRVLVMDGDSLV